MSRMIPPGISAAHAFCQRTTAQQDRNTTRYTSATSSTTNGRGSVEIEEFQKALPQACMRSENSAQRPHQPVPSVSSMIGTRWSTSATTTIAPIATPISVAIEECNFDWASSQPAATATSAVVISDGISSTHSEDWSDPITGSCASRISRSVVHDSHEVHQRATRTGSPAVCPVPCSGLKRSSKVVAACVMASYFFAGAMRPSIGSLPSDSARLRSSWCFTV